MLLEAYGDECLSHAHIFECNYRFLESERCFTLNHHHHHLYSVKDGNCQGQSHISIIDKNIAKVRGTIRKEKVFDTF